MENSIKNLVKISLAFFFLQCVLAGWAPAQKTIDLSTDKAVLAELQKKAHEMRAAIGTTGDAKFDQAMKNAKPIDAKSVCIRRIKESEKIIVIGLKESGDDCRFDGAFVDSQFYYGDDKTLSKNALDALGWQKATRAQREKLAKLWVEKGYKIKVYMSCLEGFDDGEFEKLKPKFRYTLKVQTK